MWRLPPLSRGPLCCEQSMYLEAVVCPVWVFYQYLCLVDFGLLTMVLTRNILCVLGLRSTPGASW